MPWSEHPPLTEQAVRQGVRAMVEEVLPRLTPHGLNARAGRVCPCGPDPTSPHVVPIAVIVATGREAVEQARAWLDERMKDPIVRSSRHVTFDHDRPPEPLPPESP